MGKRLTMGLSRSKRQTYTTDDAGAGQDYYWNYSTTAVAIKWAVIGAIVLLILLWLIGGYYHAQRRIRNGKRPLAYHMFLVPRRQRAQFYPQPNLSFYPQQGVYRPQQEYPLQAYPPPPPAYNADHYSPPQYQPPEGGSKVNPDQDYTAPPPGAPPGDAERGESSNAGTSSGLGRGHMEASSGSGPEMHGGVETHHRPRSGLIGRMNPFNYGSAGRHT